MKQKTTAQRRYEFILREMRIADNATDRAYREINSGRFIPESCKPQVSFAALGLAVMTYPDIYHAACRTRMLKFGFDKLPSYPGRYKHAQYNKANRPEKDIPF